MFTVMTDYEMLYMQGYASAYNDTGDVVVTLTESMTVNETLVVMQGYNTAKAEKVTKVAKMMKVIN